jgi:hypothetical protein
MKFFILATLLVMFSGIPGLAGDPVSPADSPPLNPPADDGFSLYFDAPTVAGPGSTVTVRSMLDNPAGPLAGWTLLICDQIQDDSFQIVSAHSGEAAEEGNGGAPASFSSLNLCPGNGLRQGVVIDFFGLHNLPATTGHELVVLDVKLTAPANSIATIQYCTIGPCFAGQGGETLLVHPGGVLVDQFLLHDGIIEITDSADSSFIRGDVNGSFTIDLVDPLILLEFLLGDTQISCDRAADFYDDGILNLSDVVQSLAYLFSGSEAPPAPGPGCGLDNTPDPLDCESYSGC